MNIRRLNNRGLELFGKYLADLASDPQLEVPYGLLDDHAASEATYAGAEAEGLIFSSRYEMGEYLVDKLRSFNQQKISHDAGLWSWLALFYFDQLCPADAGGGRKPNLLYNYILSQDYRHHPRHAVRTTYVFVRDYGPVVQFMFSKKPHERGEIVEQLAARQYYFSCRGIIEAAQALYYDQDRQTFKRGAAGKGAGSVRRLADLLVQLDLTYDLFTLTMQDFLNMLPREYGKFLT